MNSYQEKGNPAGSSEFQVNLSILREIAFFSEFPLEALKVFAYLCTKETFAEGDVIFSQGDDDGCAYCILSGETRLIRAYRNTEVIIRNCGEKTFYGGFSLAGNVTRPFSMIATTGTSCLVITREDFQKTIDQFPDYRKKIVQVLVNTVMAWEEQFINQNFECKTCRANMGVSLL